MFDSEGRRVGEVQETEPEWDNQQRSIMLAYRKALAETCSCGRPLVESTDPDNEGRYVVPLPARCYSCTALQQAFEAYRDADQPQALRFHAELTER